MPDAARRKRKGNCSAAMPEVKPIDPPPKADIAKKEKKCETRERFITGKKMKAGTLERNIARLRIDLTAVQCIISFL